MSRVVLIEKPQWGGKPPVRGGYRRHSRKPDRFTIHHLGGSRASYFRGIKSIQSIQAAHQTAKPKGRGWPDTGYHVVLDPLGSAYRMNDYLLRSYHSGVKGWNNNTANIGFGLYGNYDTGDVVSEAMYKTLVLLLADNCERFDIDPLGSWQDKDGTMRPNIMGHRDNGGVTKSCPGRNVYSILPKLREDVAAVIDGTRAMAVSHSLTKPVRVSVPAIKAQGSIELQSSSSSVLIVIALIIFLIRMREGK